MSINSSSPDDWLNNNAVILQLLGDAGTVMMVYSEQKQIAINIWPTG